MPPGPAYNWLCVLHSVGDVLYHAAQIRATQVAPRAVTAVKRARQTTTDAAREFEAAELGQQRPQPISLEESAQESLKSSAAPFVIPPGPKVVTSIHFRTEDKPSNVQAVPEPPLPDISALSEVRTAQADAQDLVREASPSAVQVTTPPVEAGPSMLASHIRGLDAP